MRMRAARSRVVAKTGPALPAMPNGATADAAFDERYALVCQAVAEGIYDWDIERNALSPSARLIEIFGFEGSSLGADDWNRIVHPEDFPIYRAALRDCFRGVTARLDCEYRIRHSDGAYRWVEDRALPIRNKEGRAIRLVGAVSDVTERKESERALREALERQTATAEILRVISSSPTDVQPTFDAIAAAATTLTGATSGGVFRFDGSLIHFVAHHGWTAAELDAVRDVFPLPPSRGSVTARALLTRRVAHVADIAADPEYTHLSLAQVGLHTTLSVPMLRDSSPIGAITVTRKEIEPFSDKQIDLLKTFADQAVIAIENVRLFNETREALEQQTATAEVLQVINSSPGDLKPVFDAMLEKAARLCEAETGHLLRFENGEFNRAASVGVPEDFDKLLPLNTPLSRDIHRNAVTYRMAASRSPVHVHDIREDESYRLGAPAEVAAAESGIRTALFVPLLKEGEVVGCFVMHRMEVRPFSDKQIALLENFAAQAVIAMENVRLIHETREALERQTATGEILRVISSSPTDVQPTFEAIAAAAKTLSDAALGAVFTHDGKLMHFAAGSGWAPDELDKIRSVFPMPPDRGSTTGRAVLTRRVVHIEDMSTDPEYAYPALARSGGHTVLAVPMLRDGVPIGAISVQRRHVELFSDKQIDLLKTFAAQAVIAIENVRLFNELNDRTSDLQESLEYQTATSEVLKVISGSAFDLTPVLESVVTTAVRLCRADQATIYRLQDGEYRWAAAHSLSPEYEKIEREVRIRPGTGTLIGRVALNRGTIQIADCQTDPGYEVKEDAKVGGIHTLLGVPLLREGSPIGAIGLARRRIEPYAEKEIELVRTFADQAVIAIENARLITETREALEQQTATAEILQVINSSPGDLAPVFDALLERAMRLCEAALGVLFRYDGLSLHLAASRGAAAEAMDSFRQWVPDAGSSMEEVVRGAAVVHVADVIDTDAYRSGVDSRRKLVALTGARTALWVALRKDDVLLGVMVIYRREVRPFSEKQIALLQNFAAQAVIAMENARLLGELQQRTDDLQESLEYQTATSDVLKVISRSTFDLQPVLDTLIKTAARLCDGPIAALAVRKGEGYAYVATTGVTAELDVVLRSRTFVPGRGSIVPRVLLERDVVHIIDVKADPEYNFAEVVSLGVQTLLGVPMLRQGEVIGVITVTRDRVEPFTERQIELVRTFADQAVIAIENTRLLTETREALEQQTATAEILQVINSSPGDLAPVFDAVLEKAHSLCGAAFGGLVVRDGDRFHAVALRGLPEAFADFVRRGFEAVPGNPVSMLMRGESLIHVPDATEILRQIPDDPLVRAAVEYGGVRTLLMVPLRKDTTLLGYITAYRQEPRPFADKQIALLQNFAAQAVIAMDNARLLDEIRKRQAELRVTFDNMGDGVAMFDSDMRLAAWNMNFQKILDLPDDFVAQRPTLAEYFQYMEVRGEYGSAGPVLEAEIRRGVVIADHESRFERTRPDGRVIEVRRNAVPGGGSVLIFSDVTERKRAEEAIHAARDAAETALRELKTAQANLVQAEKMASLGQLTAGIAHEIKNPLNFVNNFAGLSVELLDELKETAAPALATLDDDARAEIDETVEMLTSNLEKIGEHGRRADGIVRSMLEHSRGASGERRSVDLNALIEEALNLAYHGARAQDQNFNISLEREFGAAMAPIELVPQDMTRVFLNLFGNGFYAATKRKAATDRAFRPLLTVTTRELGDAIEVKVRDNGTGIPPEIREKLFQPFFTTKPTGEGTGLGLSISYDIVTQQHGGTIAVDSEVGKFTEFTVRLPRES
jgi:PAS domain S-box-containing protein